MNNIKYKSVLAKYMDGYLQELEQLKFCSQGRRNIKYQLGFFDRFLCEQKFVGPQVDAYTVAEWLKSLEHLKNATKCHYVSMTRGFLSYVNRYEKGCYIPAYPKRNSDFVPYIYTNEEIDVIFNAADNLRAQRRQANMIFIVIPALLRLLYSTGIRISEALSIKNKDVDFNRHIIVLNKTKNKRQRYAPLSDSMEKVIQQYIQHRNRLPVNGIDSPDRPLFVSGIGKACNQHVVGEIFKKVLSNVGVNQKDSGPRLHDLRHTSCVHGFVKLNSLGYDAYASLPLLSAFMGHSRVRSTEYYVRLTSQMYPEIFKMEAEVTASIGNLVNNVIIVDDEKKE